MERIAFIIGERFLYWSSILLTLSVVVSICVFLALYLRRSGNVIAAAIAVPVSMALSLVLARLVHWYCRADSYASLEAALTDYSSGGFALMGVFAGCFLTALLLRILFLSKNLPEMLDCMCLAGGAGIAVGRLASFFSASDRGILVESVKTLPWVYPVTNAVSGQEEYRLATFLIQAMVTGAIFLILLVATTILRKKEKIRDGDTCVLFLLCYGASQVVLDSTRYDSLFFRSNGFVSIVQVLGALAIGLALILYSIRLVRNRGWKTWYLILWLLSAVMLGLGGYMEYHVQRHGSEALFAYSVMSACLLGLVTMGALLFALAGTEKKQSSHHSHGGTFLRENRMHVGAEND